MVKDKKGFLIFIFYKYFMLIYSIWYYLSIFIKIKNVKKILVLIILVVFAGAMLSACSSVQKCPAYGNYSSYKTLKR